MIQRHRQTRRSGSVYIAVLGTSLIISMLAMSALALQRIQNRMLTNSADVRQAQLNAESAIELGLLEIRQDESWRTTHNSDDRWFTDRSVGAGTCSLDVIDPVDDDLDDDASDPIVMIGLGFSGQAEQRVEATFDPETEPLECLRSAVAVDDAIELTNSTLQTSNTAQVSANSVSASSSTVYGSVAAVSISGSTYAGTTTEVESADRPAMPDWSTVFDYYDGRPGVGGIGTEININSLPTSTSNNFGRNVGIESGTTNWTGTPPGIPTATIAQSLTKVHTGASSLRVTNRSQWYAGAAQYIDSFVEAGQDYYVEAYVYWPSASSANRNFYFSLYSKGSDSPPPNASSAVSVQSNTWVKVSGTVTAPIWNGALEYAFIKVGGADIFNTVDFYLDDFVVREQLSGRLIYQKVLGPSINPFGASTNAKGIYWLDCGGNKLIIKRSRISGTLLIVNPGSGSCVSGAVNWSPAVPGFPALMVRADNANSADLTIAATSRPLGESENGVNFNPAGAIHADFGTDADTDDIYPSEIRGLVVIGDDLTFQNDTTIRGQVIAGDDLTSTGGTLDVDFQPDSLLSPPPGFTAPSTTLRPGSVHKTMQP